MSEYFVLWCLSGALTMLAYLWCAARSGAHAPMILHVGIVTSALWGFVSMSTIFGQTAFLV